MRAAAQRQAATRVGRKEVYCGVQLAPYMRIKKTTAMNENENACKYNTGYRLESGNSMVVTCVDEEGGGRG